MSKLTKILELPTNPKELKVFEAMMPAFEDAFNYSEAKDWQHEIHAIQAALSIATSIASLRGTSWFLAVRTKLISEGLLFRGSEPIGDIAPESGLDVINRKQSLLAGFSSNGLPISVWSDRVICGEKVVPMDAFTTASVFVDGVDQITQRPTLTRMALLSPLPGSALLAGLALQKKSRDDRREVTFSISSADWQFTTKISPTAIQTAKSIAERVNAIAAKLEKGSQATAKSVVSKLSTTEELVQLKQLLDSGAINIDEFNGLKSRILGS